MIMQRWLLVACVLGTGPANAQDGPLETIATALEKPGHVELLDVLSNPDTALAPFTTDGCSGGLSHVWQTIAEQSPAFHDAHQTAPPWENCCVTHDRAYHNAGGATGWGESFNARKDADLALQSCVQNTGTSRATALAAQYNMSAEQVEITYALISDAMYLAVRAGGAPCTGLPWRWGYGYPNCTILNRLLE